MGVCVSFVTYSSFRFSFAHMQQEGPPIVPAPVPAQGTPVSANARGPQVLTPHVAGSRWPQVVRDFIWQVQRN